MVEFEEKKNINLKEGIKGCLILENIFSFLEQNKKLDLIIYSKAIRKKLGVNIKDYKIASGKYKIGGKNGFGSEYTLEQNKLIYEGEYLNGKKNGKGKEYNLNGNLSFEGEYLKGKKNGKGKEYYDNGNIKFEGEYLEGKRWNGKGYNINDIFEL